VAALAGAAGLAPAAFAGSVPDVSELPVDRWSSSPSSVGHVPRPVDLTVGERLTYDLKWAGVPAGQSVLSVRWRREFEGRPVVRVECETHSNRFVSTVGDYPVDDLAFSLIDVEGGFSRLFEMEKNEDKIHETEHIRFDYEAGIATYERRQTGAFQPRSFKTVQLSGPVQDPLSCVYYFRGLDLAPGTRVEMPVHTARRQWALVVDCLGREEIDVPGFGTRTCIRVEPSMSFPGLFVRKGRMTIWVDEETRIPVLMHVDVPIGSVTATLSGAENAALAPASQEEADVAEAPAAEAPAAGTPGATPPGADSDAAPVPRPPAR
jgi:hypothetical protein